MNLVNAGQEVKEQRRVISAAISMCFEWMLMNGVFRRLCVIVLKDTVS